jgi:hypothetical protein
VRRHQAFSQARQTSRSINTTSFPTFIISWFGRLYVEAYRSIRLLWHELDPAGETTSWLQPLYPLSRPRPLSPLAFMNMFHSSASNFAFGHSSLW